MLRPKCFSAVHQLFMKDLRENSLLLYLKCSTSSCRYVQEFFTSASKSAEVLKLINKFSITLHYAIISWSWLCWNFKIQYSNEYSKTNDCKIDNKKVFKMIDAANVVDINVYQRYWDIKLECAVCRALSKTSGNPVTKPKEKRKKD